MYLGCLVLLLSMAGCVSISSSPSPRLYMPHSLDQNQQAQKFNIPSDVIIGVGPVRIPEYLNRPQIITHDKDNLIDIAQFDRWAESVDLAILRLLNENLAVMLPGVSIVKFTWSIAVPVKYQVTADVIQVESKLEKDLRLVVRWSIVDLKSKMMVFSKRSEYIEPVEPHDYFGLNEALSKACVTMSSEIAREIDLLANVKQDNIN